MGLTGRLEARTRFERVRRRDSCEWKVVAQEAQMWSLRMAMVVVPVSLVERGGRSRG